MGTDHGWVRRIESADGWAVCAGGRWDLASARRLEADLAGLPLPAGGTASIDMGELRYLDSAGALLLHRLRQRLSDAGATVRLCNAGRRQQAMLDTVSGSFRPCATEPETASPLIQLFEHIGNASINVVDLAANFVAFVGQVTHTLGRIALRPRHLRLTATVAQMEQAGFNALPIVGLIAFLIGVVIAYQGAAQLAQFGANIFVVDLIAVSVLRELGVLLTAIVVAGRSGSAFTAQIGSMKLREEIDAMRTLGMDPVEVLVVPRMLALVITLPLLTLYADIMGLLGGGLLAWLGHGIGPDAFLERLPTVVSMSSFWVGIIKAPVFALLIAIAGCYEGMHVGNSAESLGRHTTRSVVEAIFLVIVADALFSIIFHVLGL